MTSQKTGTTVTTVMTVLAATKAHGSEDVGECMCREKRR
jgi:hypothetical protein